jgi:hypothetical protein
VAGNHPSGVDVTLTDPSAIVHTDADFLAGRCVQLAWATDVITLWEQGSDARGTVGVHVAAAEVLGCSVVVSDRSLCPSCVHADSGDFFRVPWVELLAIGSAFGREQSFALRGHSVEITTSSGAGRMLRPGRFRLRHTRTCTDIERPFHVALCRARSRKQVAPVTQQGRRPVRDQNEGKEIS